MVIYEMTKITELKEEYTYQVSLDRLVSDYICLARSVTGKHYDRPTIAFAFRWVDKSEYTSVDTEELIDYLLKLSNNKI